MIFIATPMPSAGAAATLDNVVPASMQGIVCVIGPAPTAPAPFVEHRSARGDRYAVALPTGEVVQDLLAGHLGVSALTTCLSLVHTVHAVAPAADALAISTDDGGMTIEFTDSSELHREVMFAVPDDGSVRYFVASDEGGFRKTGVVVEDAAVARLAAWLGGREPFSSEGLLLSQRSAKGS